MAKLSSDAIYFANEGKENLVDCLTACFAAVTRYGLEKLVIFTAKGEGLEAALNMKSSRSDLDEVKLVGVTFPQGKLFAEREGEQPPTRFSPELVQRLRESATPLVRARLPFDPIWSTYPTNTILAQDMTIIGNALNAFGGGMSLCFQAVLMACDSGEVDWGEHVVVMTADTALLVKAAPTDHFLTDLIVREIICKPIFLTVSRNEEPGPLVEADEASTSSNEDVNLLGVPEEQY